MSSCHRRRGDPLYKVRTLRGEVESGAEFLLITFLHVLSLVYIPLSSFDITKKTTYLFKLMGLNLE